MEDTIDVSLFPHFMPHFFVLKGHQHYGNKVAMGPAGIVPVLVAGMTYEGPGRK